MSYKAAKKELRLSFWKRLTGKQNPTKLQKFFSIAITVFFFLVTFFLEYILANALIPTTANVNFGSYVEGDYIPIEITNGAKQLDSGELNVKTCFMKNYQNYSVSSLVPTQSYPIHFKNNETLFSLGQDYDSQSKCNPNNISTTAQCWINIYLIESNLYAPSQECIVKRCDYCDYSLLYRVKGKTIFNDTEKFSATEIQKYVLNVSSSLEIPNFENKNKTYFGKVGISFYTEYESCILYNDTNCSDYSNDFNGERLVIIEYPDNLPSSLKLNVTYISREY